MRLRPRITGVGLWNPLDLWVSSHRRFSECAGSVVAGLAPPAVASCESSSPSLLRSITMFITFLHFTALLAALVGVVALDAWLRGPR